MKTPQKFNKSKEWLIENYLNTDKSFIDIAKMVGCSPSIVRKWVLKFGITPKDKYRAAKVNRNFEKYRKEKGSWNKGLGMEDERVREAVKNSAKTRKIRGSNLGQRHASWKGELISYKALHSWLKRHKGKAEKCINCGSIENVEWANKSHEYKRDLMDFIELCKKCHTKYDMLEACKYGHKYTIQNTHIDKHGWRICRQCARDQYHKHKGGEL